MYAPVTGFPQKWQLCPLFLHLYFSNRTHTIYKPHNAIHTMTGRVGHFYLFGCPVYENMECFWFSFLLWFDRRPFCILVRSIGGWMFCDCFYQATTALTVRYQNTKKDLEVGRYKWRPLCLHPFAHRHIHGASHQVHKTHSRT